MLLTECLFLFLKCETAFVNVVCFVVIQATLCVLLVFCLKLCKRWFRCGYLRIVVAEEEWEELFTVGNVAPCCYEFASTE